MSDIPLPIIGIVLAIFGFILTRALTPTKRRPLSEMRPEFERTILDKEELGNEAMDMDLVRRVEAENQKMTTSTEHRWTKKWRFGSHTRAAFEEHLGDRK